MSTEIRAQALALSEAGAQLLLARAPRAAILVFRRALALDPAAHHARSGLADALERVGETGEALRQYRVVAWLTPDDHDAALAVARQAR